MALEPAFVGEGSIGIQPPDTSDLVTSSMPAEPNVILGFMLHNSSHFAVTKFAMERHNCIRGRQTSWD